LETNAYKLRGGIHVIELRRFHGEGLRWALERAAVAAA